MLQTNYRLKLFGVVRLLNPAGHDVTPRMAKTQGLLAYLAIAKGEPVHRTILQDLLWSDRMPQQGRDSLKKALSELRACFSDTQANPLLTTGGPVALDMAQIVLEGPELKGARRPEFLEGIDIKDEEFNKWLLMQRLDDNQFAALPVERAAVELRYPLLAQARSEPLLEIGILPLEVLPRTAEMGQLADILADTIVDLSLQSGAIKCYDFRHQRPTSPSGDRTADVWMRLQLSRGSGRARFRISLIHQPTSRMVWSGTRTFQLRGQEVEEIEVWAEQVFDECCASMARFDGFASDEHRAARLTFAAIDRVYRLTNADIDSAAAHLDEARSLAGTSTIYGWSAFLTAFQLEKSGGGSGSDLCERARSLSARALELDRTNRLTVALVAHVYSFVLQDLDRAAELLDPFLGEPSQSAMLADTLSTYCLYRGDYASAERYANEALARGRFNPFRYSFTTSLAMAQLMQDRPDHAIHSCQVALAQHPIRDGHLYEPTLRTLAAAAGATGRKQLGARALDTLGGQGGFDARDRILSPGFKHPNAAFAQRIKLGVENVYAN